MKGMEKALENKKGKLAITIMIGKPEDEMEEAPEMGELGEKPEMEDEMDDAKAYEMISGEKMPMGMPEMEQGDAIKPKSLTDSVKIALMKKKKM